jgi:hypothetical protein
MSDCCPEIITKKDPCWEGYVQRGMKPGKNGAMVPNCVPVEKTDTPMDVANNPTVTDPAPASPSSNINPKVGMRKPNYLTASRKAKKKKTNKVEMSDLYSMLSEEEKAFTDALNGIAGKFGKLKEDGGIWIGYVPAVVNEDAYMGVMCKNCVFFEGNNGCSLIEQKVEEAGICRLAAIPDDLITPEESDGTYDGCGCMTCMSLNCDCENCPVCGAEMENDMPMQNQDIAVEKTETVNNNQKVIKEESVNQKSFWSGFIDIKKANPIMPTQANTSQTNTTPTNGSELWSISPFKASGIKCTSDSPACNDPMCKVCSSKKR